uniref:Uncharacterized protein n=1 Tax=Marmota marmota marmota TaxID=9994 RepID=A0A8C5ZMB4_MARMA
MSTCGVLTGVIRLIYSLLKIPIKPERKQWRSRGLFSDQTEKTAAEIAGMPDKKKKLLKEKKWAVLVLSALEHSDCALKECEEGGWSLKETKTKPPPAPRANAVENPSLSLTPRKKPSSKEDLVSSDFEETACSASLPKERNLYLRKTGDPEEAAEGMAPRKKRIFSSRKEPLRNAPKKAGSRNSSTQKKKKLHKASFTIWMTSIFNFNEFYKGMRSSI